MLGNVAFSQPLVDGFNKGKGNMDLVMSYSYDTFKKYYAAPGLINLNRNTNVVSFFTAIGITNKWTMQASIPYVTTGSESSLQDMSIISKLGIMEISLKKGKLSFLVSNGVLFPLTNYQTEGISALGQQATSLDNRIIGQYFHNNGMFVMGQSGYTLRLDPVPSSIPLSLKVGLAKEKNYFDAWIDYQKGEKGNSYRDGFNTSFRNFTVSYTKVGVTYYRALLNKLGVALNLSNTLTGDNVGKSTTVSLAVIYKLKYN